MVPSNRITVLVADDEMRIRQNDWTVLDVATGAGALELLRTGASGLLPKTADLEELRGGVQMVARGQVYVSPTLAVFCWWRSLLVPRTMMRRIWCS